MIVVLLQPKMDHHGRAVVEIRKVQCKERMNGSRRMNTGWRRVEEEWKEEGDDVTRAAREARIRRSAERPDSYVIRERLCSPVF